ncbi:hypothetical protein XENTR_v10010936 [Xenopus tropicalis]|nr:hypothetical protein XENTR_v10010936 [Xenopus tropicalis]
MGEHVEGVSTYIRQCILMCVAERAGACELTISTFFPSPHKVKIVSDSERLKVISRHFLRDFLVIFF